MTTFRSITLYLYYWDMWILGPYSEQGSVGLAAFYKHNDQILEYKIQIQIPNKICLYQGNWKWSITTYLDLDKELVIFLTVYWT